VIFLVVFVAAVAVLGWTWVGWPLAAWLRARFLARPVQARPGFAPAVSVIIVARDEEKTLPAKLQSLRRGGLPAERLEILVVDDGSRDATALVAAAAGARLIALSDARGKAQALNSAVRRARHEILVFTDARQPLAEGALARLVAPLADPDVGAVGGEIENAASGAGAVYRKLDDALRRWEAASGSAIGVAGAFWACRRSLFPRLPAGILLDDLYAPLAVARRGARVVIARDARVVERAGATEPDVERRRRIRTLAGNFQLVARAPWTLVPVANPLWFSFWSHKLLRLAGPAALAAALAALAVLAPRGGIWTVFAVVAAAGLGLAAAGARAGALGRLARSFIAAQGLVVVALVHALRGTTPWRTVAAGSPRALELGSAEVSHGL
jgi:cellulose synthase/poly-beta-1,6-N-acetylglucosamine synthase-like glycosyltransferase